MDAAELIANAKGTARISYRALAAQAGVAASTITRIEANTTEPSFTTVERLLEACGFGLRVQRVSPRASGQPHLGDLAGAWESHDRGAEVRLHWTTWRALLDRLALHPEWVPEAIYVPPPPAGHASVDTLLAGIAEKLADDHGLLRPSWTASIPPLDVPFAPPARRRGDIPPQLEERGVLIDRTSLFREPSTVGL